MKGFTLVEMLAALFVFGLLTAAGATVLGSTLRGQEAVRSRMDQIGDLQRTRSMLKADISQLADRPTRDVNGVAEPGPMIGRRITGDAPFLTLTRRGWENPDGAARASLQHVEYGLVGNRLERSVRGALDGGRMLPPQVMLTGVRSLKVEYLNRRVWTPDWVRTPNETFPQAVRVTADVEGLGAFEQILLTPESPR